MTAAHSPLGSRCWTLREPLRELLLQVTGLPMGQESTECSHPAKVDSWRGISHQVAGLGLKTKPLASPEYVALPLCTLKKKKKKKNKDWLHGKHLVRNYSQTHWRLLTRVRRGSIRAAEGLRHRESLTQRENPTWRDSRGRSLKPPCKRT